MENEMISTHELEFEVAPWEIGPMMKALLPDDQRGGLADLDWARFRIGTCEGLWGTDDKSIYILALENNDPGNGHFEDVLEWFEYGCKRDKKTFVILEVSNTRFKHHLITKRGFSTYTKHHVIKYLQNMD